MARLNVYVPDDLAAQVRAAELNVSRISQDALRAALASRAVDSWLDSLAERPPLAVSADAVGDAVAAAKDDLAGV